MRRFPDFFVNCGYGGGRLPLPGEAALSGNSARWGSIFCRRLPERKVYSVKIILIRTLGHPVAAAASAVQRPQTKAGTLTRPGGYGKKPGKKARRADFIRRRAVFGKSRREKPTVPLRQGRVTARDPPQRNASDRSSAPLPSRCRGRSA